MKHCKKRLLDILESNNFKKLSVENEQTMLTELQSQGRMNVMVDEISKKSVVVQCPKRVRSYQGEDFKICDFLLLNWIGKTEVEVFFFELKKTRSDLNVKKAKEQIQGTKSWLQQYVIPKIKEKFTWCEGLGKIREHHVILCEGSKQGIKPTRFFQKYSAEGKSDSPWPCSKHMLNGVCCQMNTVSLQQIRDEAKA